MTRTFLLEYGSRGARVKELQRLLNVNPFYKPARKLVIDGDMRTLTCAAVQQAKHRLGYPAENVTPVAGQALFDYLAKNKPMPAAYLANMASRAAATPKMPATPPIAAAR